MRSDIRFGLLALAIGILAPSSAAGQTAKEVVDRYVDVIGGRAALDRIKTIRTERILVHLEEDLIIRTTTSRKRPRLYRSESSLPSGLIVNGDRAWQAGFGPEGRASWREAEVPRTTDFEAQLGWFIGYEEKGYEVDFLGTETIDGVEMHHLRMTWLDGATRELYFDVSTGLFTMFKPTSWGSVRVHDYRPVAGVLFPHFTEARGTRPDGLEIHHLNMVVSIQVNRILDDSLFHPPGVRDDG